MNIPPSCNTVDAWFQSFGDISSKSLFSPARKKGEKKVYLIDRCRRVGDETSEIDVRKDCMFIFGHAQVSHANTGCTSFSF